MEEEAGHEQQADGSEDEPRPRSPLDVRSSDPGYERKYDEAEREPDRDPGAVLAREWIVRGRRAEGRHYEQRCEDGKAETLEVFGLPSSCDAERENRCDLGGRSSDPRLLIPAEPLPGKQEADEKAGGENDCSRCARRPIVRKLGPPEPRGREERRHGGAEPDIGW